MILGQLILFLNFSRFLEAQPATRASNETRVYFIKNLLRLLLWDLWPIWAWFVVDRAMSLFIRLIYLFILLHPLLNLFEFLSVFVAFDAILFLLDFFFFLLFSFVNTHLSCLHRESCLIIINVRINSISFKFLPFFIWASRGSTLKLSIVTDYLRKLIQDSLERLSDIHDSDFRPMLIHIVTLDSSLVMIKVLEELYVKYFIIATTVVIITRFIHIISQLIIELIDVEE